jgi:hypothetical protein
MKAALIRELSGQVAPARMTM